MATTYKDKLVSYIGLKDKVTVSDPCYEPDIWCAKNLENVFPGSYAVFQKVASDPRWGSWICELYAKHVFYLDIEIPDGKDKNVKPERLCVDSGEMGIFDYDLYRKIHNGEDTEWQDYACRFNNYGKEYFVSRSGFGDGDYPLFVAKNNNGNIVAMKIVFCSDQEENYEI